MVVAWVPERGRLKLNNVVKACNKTKSTQKERNKQDRMKVGGVLCMQKCGGVGCWEGSQKSPSVPGYVHHPSCTYTMKKWLLVGK